MFPNFRKIFTFLKTQTIHVFNIVNQKKTQKPKGKQEKRDQHSGVQSVYGGGAAQLWQEDRHGGGEHDGRSGEGQCLPG